MLSTDVLTLADVLDGQVFGCQQPENISVSGASIDTRDMPANGVFFAFKGQHVDGHDYLDAAKAAGASVAIVEQIDAQCELPQIMVDNVKSALGRVAYWWRDQITAKVIAITGSNGKTTVKEMLYCIFSQVGETVATKGNLNNELGMPLTLLRVSKDTQFAVLEMGANHFSEIDYMSGIARPDIALVNNAGPAHLQGFGDVLGVAKAKGEIYNGLRANGIAIINADDERSDIWRSQCAHLTMRSFAMQTGADVQGEWHSDAQTLLLSQHCGGESTTSIQLNLIGQHNALNALAAATVALSAHVELVHIKTGLETLHAVKGRLKPISCQNYLLVIDDTYNANPASLMAGVNVALEREVADVWVAMGDLGEMGDQEQAIHTSLGEQFLEAGVKRVYAYGELSQNTVHAFGDQGQSFTHCELLIDTLVADVRKAISDNNHNQNPISILVKGSRARRMERVVDALIAAFGV